MYLNGRVVGLAFTRLLVQTLTPKNKQTKNCVLKSRLYQSRFSEETEPTGFILKYLSME
jgi:hypothetical protein